MKKIILLILAAFLLSSCQTNELVKTKQDLEACQVMLVYVICLDGDDPATCDTYLCDKYPDAEPCRSE